MLLIKTKLKDAGPKGLGLFTEEFIFKDQIIWQEQIDFDRKYTKEDILKFPQLVQNWIQEYSPYDGKYHYVDLDFCKHMNHSWEPNIRFIGDVAIALKDIPIGQELVTDYSDFDIAFRKGDYGFTIL